MTKILAILLLTVCLTGCTIKTAGHASWEVYGGVRTRQHGDKPAKISIQSSVVDKIVDALTDGEVAEDE